MRYFISLSFKGTAFHGWQTQKNATSVQDSLESALSVFFGAPVSLTGCGRTDTGVHARNYTAHFDTDKEPQDTELWKYKINAILGADISVSGIFPVSPSAHARFDATSREYRYFIHTEKDPFLKDYSWFLPSRPALDIEAMNLAAALLLGRHDFSSFAKLHSQTKTNICTVTTASWTREGNRLVFTIIADRFLRNMVRAIVGSLVEIGQGRHPVEWIPELLDERNRCSAGNSVPAQGLFLWEVRY